MAQTNSSAITFFWPAPTGWLSIADVCVRIEIKRVEIAEQLGEVGSTSGRIDVPSSQVLGADIEGQEVGNVGTVARFGGICASELDSCAAQLINGELLWGEHGSSPCWLFWCWLEIRQEQIRAFQLHLWRYAPRRPVLHSLDAALQFKAHQLCDLDCAAQVLDSSLVEIDLLLVRHGFQRRSLNMAFSLDENTAFNNTLFSWGNISSMEKTAKPKHASWIRLMEVAKLHDVVGPSAVADLFEEVEQTVTNWGTRGVSKFGALKAQEHFGVAANWILKGTQPQWIGERAKGSSNPDETSPVAANEGGIFKRMTDDEREVIDDLRDLTDDDRMQLTAEIKRRADIQRRHSDKMLEQLSKQMGFPIRRYASASLAHKAAVKITDRLKQRDLLDDTAE